MHRIESYLDVFDVNAAGTGDALADHVKAEMGNCTQLLAVVSQATQGSWWVPWEIGIATEKDYPLATYVGGGAVSLPDYLRKWPYLQTHVDLDRYAAASKAAANDFEIKKRHLTEDVARIRSTKEFHRVLKSSLGQ